MCHCSSHSLLGQSHHNNKKRQGKKKRKEKTSSGRDSLAVWQLRCDRAASVASMQQLLQSSLPLYSPPVFSQCIFFVLRQTGQAKKARLVACRSSSHILANHAQHTMRKPDLSFFFPSLSLAAVFSLLPLHLHAWPGQQSKANTLTHSHTHTYCTSQRAALGGVDPGRLGSERIC